MVLSLIIVILIHQILHFMSPNDIESLLIEIANFNYFDPLYHYIEQEYGIDPVTLAKYRKGQGFSWPNKEPSL